MPVPLLPGHSTSFGSIQQETKPARAVPAWNRELEPFRKGGQSPAELPATHPRALGCNQHLPISTFTDDLHFKVINATGCRDGVSGPDRGSIFVIFTVT